MKIEHARLAKGGQPDAANRIDGGAEQQRNGEGLSTVVAGEELLGPVQRNGRLDHHEVDLLTEHRHRKPDAFAERQALAVLCELRAPRRAIEPGATKTDVFERPVVLVGVFLIGPERSDVELADRHPLAPQPAGPDWLGAEERPMWFRRELRDLRVGRRNRRHQIGKRCVVSCALLKTAPSLTDTH
jgi:hypothetical protein